MAFANSFHRLVLDGTIYSERWNTSVAIIGALPEVSDEMLTETAAVVNSWFISTGGSNTPNFLGIVKLVGIKLNRIGEDGRYEDPESRTFVYPTPLSGGFSTTPYPAPQLATVATLRTAADRGRANRGRMYLPPNAGFVNPQVDGRAIVADALRVSNSIASLFNLLRAQYSAQYGPGADTGHVGVTSNIGTGTERKVTNVETGRIIDTMRSRRTSLVEDRQVNTTAIVTT